MALQPSIAYEDDIAVVHQVIVGRLDNNVYVIQSKNSSQALLIDAADSPAELLKWAQALGVTQAIITHGHGDHIGAVPAFLSASIPVAIGEEDVDYLPTRTSEVADGDTFQVGPLTLRAVHTPGHTPGSMCFVLENTPVLFTGDTLFPGGPGATANANASFPDIIDSIRTRLFSLPDETLVLPGHGLSTTVGTEKPRLQEWIDRGW